MCSELSIGIFQTSTIDLLNSEMVCFARSGYNVPLAQCENWFRLLARYLGGVQITVTFSADESTKTTGSASQEFFDSLPRDKGDFIIETEPFYDQLPCMRALPPLCDVTDREDQQELTLTKALQEALERVLSICEHRKTLDGREVHLSCKFSIDKNDMPVLFDALKQHQKQQADPIITHAYLDNRDGRIFLLVVGGHPISVTANGVSDGTLPVLDFDDGFVGNTATDSMHQRFLLWKELFRNTNGDSWHVPILSNPITVTVPSSHPGFNRTVYF